MTTATLADLASALEQQNQRIEASIHASRVTNALLLAQAMRLDMTEPKDAQQVLRHLRMAERYVMGDSND